MLEAQLLRKSQELLEFFSPLSKGELCLTSTESKFAYAQVAQLQTTVATYAAELARETEALASERRLVDTAFLDLHRSWQMP